MDHGADDFGDVAAGKFVGGIDVTSAKAGVLGLRVEG